MSEPGDLPESFVAEHLACVRGPRLVFTDLSFSVAPGEIVLVRGPNGSGKSSLLRLAAGLLKPAAGRIAWGGRALGDIAEAHRRRIRYVGHLEAQKAALTAAENLAFWTSIHGGRDASVVAQALAAFEIAHLANLPVRFLSAGQRRRLALSRLAASPGHLWLLDEPTVSLDGDGIACLARHIERHRARGGSALIATHGAFDVAETRTVRLAAPAAADIADA